MRPVGHDDVVKQSLFEEMRRGHAAPRIVFQRTFFHLRQQVALPVRRQCTECRLVCRFGFLIQRLQAKPPGCPLPRHVLRAEAVLNIVQQFRVDQPSDRNRRPVHRGCGTISAAIVSTIANSWLEKKRGVRGTASLRSITRRVCLFQDGVWRFASTSYISRGSDQASWWSRSSPSAASPAKARPVKLGGAGSGGPSTRFWLQFRQPPMAR
jgi:hypothetical protein